MDNVMDTQMDFRAEQKGCLNCQRRGFVRLRKSRSLFSVIRHRKGFIFVTIALALLLEWFSLSLIPPLYEARALIKVKHENVAASEELMKSRSFAQEVMQNYGFSKDSETDLLLSGMDGKFKTLSLETEIDLGEAHLQKEQNVLDFSAHLKLETEDNSNVIKVSYVAMTPEKAASMANATVQQFLKKSVESKLAASQNAAEWRARHFKKLKERLQNSEAGLAAFRKKNGLIYTDHADDQLIIMQNRLFKAETARLDERERLSNFKQLSLSPIDNEFMAQQGELEQELQKLSQRYGPKHPKLIKAKQELKALQTKIQKQPSHDVENVNEGIDTSGEYVNAIKDQIEHIKKIRQEDDGYSVLLKQLEQKVALDRRIFEKFIEDSETVPPQEVLDEQEVQIISYAVLPDKPSYPDKIMLLSLAGIFAAILGIIIAFVLEKYNRGIKGALQLENLTGYPCYAILPQAKGIKKGEIVKFLIDKPSSDLAEAVRSLRMTLKYRKTNDAQQRKVIAVTSSFPGEGKTTLSSWLATSSARSGEKVILIDADLRRPSLQNMIQGRGDKTLSEYLAGQVKLEDIIVKDPVSGLHKIYARSLPTSALEMIGSQKMTNLVETLKKVYDLVIIDTPASLAVSDAAILSHLSDQVLYAVHWNQTEPEPVFAGIRQFQDMGFDNIAFILTNVDMSEHARYVLGKVIYDYQNYREYT